jgi:hypothetical protein
MIVQAIRLISALVTVNLATLAIGGDLNPPGPPASTPGPEPRTPITAIPATIEESGSYVVVANLTLTATDTHGITINASNVTIDLNGHTLTGPGKAAGTLGDGIHASAISDNIAVFNGMVRDFRWRGIFLGGGNNRIWQITADNNGDDGIETFANSVILNSCSRGNGACGIFTGYTSVVRNNSCFQNGDDGILVGFGSSVTGNACYLNSDDGISAGAGSSVTENACRGNTGNGIDAVNSLVSHNACQDNTGTNLVNTGLSVDNYAP